MRISSAVFGQGASVGTGVVLRIQVWPEERQADLWYASLRRIGGPTRAHPGCLSYQVYRSGEGSELMLIEEWASRQALEAHIRSADFRVILSAIDASTREPDFRVDTVGVSEGLEYVASILGAQEA